MSQFQEISAPIAAVVGAVLLALQLIQAFMGNRTLFTGLLILISLVAIGAGMWKYAFEPSVIKEFPRYRFYWVARIALILILLSALGSAAYIFTIIKVVPDCCGLIAPNTTIPMSQTSVTTAPSTSTIASIITQTQAPFPNATVQRSQASATIASTITQAQAPVPNQTPIVGNNCFGQNIWTPYEKDQTVTNDGGCWNLNAWGFTPKLNGLLLVPFTATGGQAHGLYTPISDTTTISFIITVDKFAVDPSRTGNITIGIINLATPGLQTSRVIYYHYIPTRSTHHIAQQVGTDAQYGDLLPVFLSFSTPQNVAFQINGPLMNVTFDQKNQTQLTIPFDKRAFWISYSVPTDSQLIATISNLQIH